MAMSGDISESHDWVCEWHLIEARDSANHATVPRPVPRHREVSGPSIK